MWTRAVDYDVVVIVVECIVDKLDAGEQQLQQRLWPGRTQQTK